MTKVKGPVCCDLFIRSYRKDFDWLSLCLGAIRRHCRGFGEVVVVVPNSSRGWLRRLPELDVNVRVECCPDYRDDYLGQQVTKLLADTYSNADFICHVDSDCIFQRTVTPRDLIVDERPIITRRPYEELGRHWPWKSPTQAFLGWDVSHDFMQRPPFIYPRWLYAMLRAHATAVHGMDLERYVITRHPRGFSEFNALGAYAWARHREMFEWVEARETTWSQDTFCRWYWSWGGLDGATRNEIQGILAQAPEAQDHA